MKTAAEFAAGMPEVTEGSRYGRRTWFVRTKAFAWERPLTKADIKRYGDEAPPAGPLLALAVEDLGEKEAVLAAGTVGIFTIAHFNGYPAVLVQLDAVTEDDLRAAITDAWLAVAPEPLAAAYLADHPD